MKKKYTKPIVSKKNYVSVIVSMTCSTPGYDRSHCGKN